MPTVDEQVSQARLAYQAGRATEARDLLLDAVQRDPDHENAWLWLSAMVDSLEDQQICLENVLALNPTHERARKGLTSVERKMAEMAERAERASAAVPTHAPARDENAPVTSVEWARADGPSVYGSGKQVRLPSGKEYDEWVHALHLADEPVSPPVQAAPFLPDEAHPFGDTAFMVNTSPFVDDGTLPDDDPWAELQRAARQPRRSAAEDRAPAPPAAAPQSPRAPEVSRAAGYEFSFDEADQAALTDLAAAPAIVVPVPPAPAPASAPVSSAAPQPASGPEAYFAYIPDEIKAARGGPLRSLALILAAIILLIANGAALLALLDVL